VLPTLSGCRIEAAYLPAEEVGGDFYQILPQTDGSTLFAIGDVSGKGLKAAMTGALAIGALRALAANGLGPAAVLKRLNEEMVRAQNGGFVTCLCAALGSNGQLRFANAGHLPPYLNGVEVEMPGSLPLGVSAAAEYEEATMMLDAGDQLTFLSDGVVEAQNAAGELFGFERTQELSLQGALELAEAACKFGQEDDITVLTLTRLVAAEALGEDSTMPIPA
jgi:serine phosphatase RsbU (regulator of sigma subunit)